MKKIIYVLILVIFTTILLYSAEPLKKGETYTAKEDVLILSKNEANNYYKYLKGDLYFKINELENILIPNLKLQISELENERDLWKFKFNATEELMKVKDQRIKTLEIQNKIAWVLAGTSISISAGLICGLSIYVSLKVNDNK